MGVTSKLFLLSWRIANSALLVVSFVGPWLYITESNQTTQGYAVAAMSAMFLVVVMLQGLFTHFEGIVVMFVFLGAIAGSAGLCLYALSSVIVSIFGRSATKFDHWFNSALLIASGIGLASFGVWGVGVARLINYQGVAWGYWLAWIGLVSSIMAEVVESALKAHQHSASSNRRLKARTLKHTQS